MSEWVLSFAYMFAEDQYVVWLRGTLEEVLADALGPWPGNAVALRIEREKV